MLEPNLFLSLVLGALVAAAVLIAVRENKAARTPEQRDLIKLEIKLSLSTLPPNVVAISIGAIYWSAAFLWLENWAIFKVRLAPAFEFMLAIVAADFSYYCEHRAAHRSRMLWRLYHGVHHTSRFINVPSAYRISFLHQVPAPLFYLPWVFAGFSAESVLFAQLFVLHYQAWTHTDCVGRLRFFDGWLNTPANHRMHHSLAHGESPKNFAAVLMIWDRLFGTYVRPNPASPYGIPGMGAPTTIRQLYLLPWKRTDSRRRSGNIDHK